MAFERLTESAFQGSEWATLLWTSAARRRDLALTTNAYRVSDGGSDGTPGLVIERYADFAVIHVYEDAGTGRVPRVAEALRELGARGVYVKDRLRADLRTVARSAVAPEIPLLGEAAPFELPVQENGLEFLVRLADGLSTGLFVDQRDNRAWLRQAARGKRVLNLFAYTGSFSVAAGAGGAQQVTTVDLSQAALKRCDANLKRNQEDPKRHRLLRADAIDWLRRALQRGDTYDRIVLDPPSFSSDGAETFSVARQYGDAVAQCLRLLSPEGELLAVTNHRGTSVSTFSEILHQAADTAGKRVRSLELPAAPLDCVESRVAPDLGTKSAWVRLD
jgi:23S rRNA (cytosine1962-C5)-methyltransferase